MHAWLMQVPVILNACAIGAVIRRDLGLVSPTYRVSNVSFKKVYSHTCRALKIASVVTSTDATKSTSIIN